MKVVLIGVVCLLLSTAACAQFSLTAEPAGPGAWEYTLYSNGVNAEIPWYLDIDWVPGWDDGKSPEMTFTVTGSPEASLWYEGTLGFPWPTWDCWGVDPEPGNSLGGFVVESAEPGAYFRVGYESDLGDELEWEGEIDVVPEPSSILAVLCGMGGLVWRRRTR